MPTFAQKIIPPLWFTNNAEEAARFYASIFPNSRVHAAHEAASDYPVGKQGNELTVDFTVFGRPFFGLTRLSRRWLVLMIVVALAAPLGAAAANVPAASTVAGSVGKLAVDDGGPSGGSALPPVLFVHSFAGSKAHWKSALEHLRRTRPAVAFDFRGHGGSAAPRDDQAAEWSINAIAADVGAVADALGLRRFVISMGGSVASSYAGSHPERVAGLVLVGTPGKAPPELAKKTLDALSADYDKTMQGYWQSLLKNAKPDTKSGREAEMKQLSQAQSMALIRATFAFDPLPAIGRYPGPKVIIDTEGSEGAAALHTQLPQIERKLIPGTSHWVQLDAPKAFESALDAFLATVR